MLSSIADPGSGIRCFFQFFDPGSGMSIPDNFSERLETVFRVKNTKFFDADPDPGSGTFSPWIRDGKNRIWDKHPGYATLMLRLKRNFS
jgi:hypothetical protein